MEIHLPEKIRGYIEQQIKMGIYSDVSDYIAKLTRKNMENDRKLKSFFVHLDNMSEEEFSPLDIDIFLEKMKAKYA